MRLVRSSLVVLTAIGIGLTTLADQTVAQPFVPKNRGLPGRRAGSGTRGACSQIPAAQVGSMVAFMPQSNLGTTTSDYPTLAWYVPTTQATTATFVLLDEQQHEIYSTEMNLLGQPGILRVVLPSSIPPLKTGMNYRWKFVLTCDSDEPSNNLLTEGWLQRVVLDETVQQQLQSASLRERAAIYAREGVWYDALSTLMMLRQSQPNNAALTKDWQSLLESIDLGSIATATLLP